MDRKTGSAWVSEFPKLVALRKESVDRKINSMTHTQRYCVSLSARRAWIEKLSIVIHIVIHVSLSARRAWIEKPIPAPLL